MNEKEKNFENGSLNKRAATYSIGQIVNTWSYQTFALLIFTFYFAVVGLHVIWITIGFLIWAIWNSINDPILGYFSDHTHTKWGRRFPYIMISIVPLSIVIILMFSPPIFYGVTDKFTNFIYFLIIIIAFELFYTMFDLNLAALFPELFITEEERTTTNVFRMTFYIIALIFAFALPALFIPDFSNPKYLREFQMYSIIVAIIIVVFGILFLKFSPKEKAEFSEDYKNAPSFFVNLKTCVKNKAFRRYIPADMAIWFVIGIQTTIVPLYGKFVLDIGEGETIFLAILLGLTFISVAIFLNILWKPVVRKVGPRKGWLIAVSVYFLTIIPLMFITDRWQGMVVFFIVGIGLAGPIYIWDLIMADIIDEDEVNTGARSEAGYYGIKAFFFRLSTIFVFLSIALVFTNVGWAIFEPENVTPEIIFGLRALMFIFPAVALGIAFITVYRYPLYGKRLTQIKEKLQKIHDEKKSKI